MRNYVIEQDRMLMTDSHCIRFLQWALPRLNYRWEGFRKVRKQVCKRILRRVQELNLSGLDAYGDYLLSHPEEWGILDSCCRITISRFFRDRRVFQALYERVLPDLCRRVRKEKRRVLRCLSIGCASGEEPYSLSLIWRFGLSIGENSFSLDIIGMDADRTLLGRARRACYPASALKDLPVDFVQKGFDRKGDLYGLKKEIRDSVVWIRQDVRKNVPTGPFDIVFCRNLVFTYFRPGLQGEILAILKKQLVPQGVLVIGSRERLPEDSTGFLPGPGPCLFIRAPGLKFESTYPLYFKD